MTIAIVDFTEEPFKDDTGDNEVKLTPEGMESLLNSPHLQLLFSELLLITMFRVLQKGYTPFYRDIAEAIVGIKSYRNPQGKYELGRSGVCTISSPWAKEHYPEAEFVAVFTLVNTAEQKTHTFIVYI